MWHGGKCLYGSCILIPHLKIGDIPLSFYDSYPHIGYDINGKRILRPATGEALDSLLDSIELPEGWTGLTDPETGKPLNLTRDELELLRRVQMKELPEEGYDMYPVCIARNQVIGMISTDSPTGYCGMVHQPCGTIPIICSPRTEAALCALEARG